MSKPKQSLEKPPRIALSGFGKMLRSFNFQLDRPLPQFTTRYGMCYMAAGGYKYK
jgi:hypothetical protein